MSYKPILTVYNLTFTDFPGLHVKMYASNLGEIMDIQKTDFTNPTDKQVSGIFNFLADKLVMWDVLHPELRPDKSGKVPTTCPVCGLKEDAPVPATLDGMRCLEPEFIQKIVEGYLGQVTQPDPKASSALNNGVTPETLRRLAERQNPLKSNKPN